MIAAALQALVPPTKAGRTFAFVALVDSMGTGCYLAGATVFFLKVVGLSATAVATGLAIGSAAGFVSVVPLGALMDRYGAHRMLIALQSWRTLWFVALAFTRGPMLFTLVSICLLTAERSISPATQAVVGAAVGDTDRVRTLAAMRSVRNIGFSVGAALTAPLLAFQTTAAYRSVILLDALSFAVSVFMLGRLRLPVAPKAARKRSPLNSSGASRTGAISPSPV